MFMSGQTLITRGLNELTPLTIGAFLDTQN